MQKERYSRQYLIKSVPVEILWTYISDDAGLQTWYADKVTHEGDTYSFDWKGHEEQSTLIDSEFGEYVRFRRDGDPDYCYWEMRIGVDEITDDTVLTVTDFAELGEAGDDGELWDAQVMELRRSLGC